jgi:hypothetical protein
MAIDPTWLKTNVYNIIMDGVSSPAESLMQLASELTGLTPPGGGTDPADTGGNSAPLQKGKLVIMQSYNQRMWTVNKLDDIMPHHSSHKQTNFNVSPKANLGNIRTVTWRKSGYLNWWSYEKQLDSGDLKKFQSDSANYKHVVYDFNFFVNGKTQPVGIYAPFDCKVFKSGIDSYCNSYMLLTGIGPAKGKTAAFLHIVPKAYNTNATNIGCAGTAFAEKVNKLLQQETQGKTFRKGELMAYQGNWGAGSSGNHLHIEAMTKADLDQYITDLPSFYK